MVLVTLPGPAPKGLVSTVPLYLMSPYPEQELARLIGMSEAEERAAVRAARLRKDVKVALANMMSLVKEILSLVGASQSERDEKMK